MGQTVHTYQLDTIEKMKKYYINDMTSSLPPGAIFRAKTNNAVITAYKSGKVLFQGSNPQLESSIWDSGVQQPKKQQQTQYGPPQSLFTSSHIGSDESGTGDYFGPVTTCALYVKHEQIDELRQLGIQDSKAITDENVIKLSEDLVKLNIPYSLLILHNEKYNTLQRQGWSQGKMKAMLHHHAIKNVVDKITGEQYEGILIDQFCQPDVYQRYIKTENESLLHNTFFMTKAESYSIAVAAASVIARASFLKEMEKLSLTLGYNLLKGASQRVDKLIGKMIREQGEDILQTCAKLHFANTEKGRKFI